MALQTRLEANRFDCGISISVFTFKRKFLQPSSLEYAESIKELNMENQIRETNFK